jgi:Predicted membrane protein (DUF2306)
LNRPIAFQSSGGWSWRAWAPPTYFILLGIGALAIGLTHLLIPSSVQAPSVAAFAGAEYAAQQLPAFDHNPLLVHLHAVLGTTFTLILPFQFWRTFRVRHRRLHRIMGFIAMSCVTLLAISGVAVSIVYPFAGPAGVLPNVFWMSAILFCTAAALWKIRHRDVAGHEIWITRAMAMTLGITLSRLYDPLLILVFHVAARPALATVFWLGAGESLLVAEFWLRRRLGKRPQAKTAQDSDLAARSL